MSTSFFNNTFINASIKNYLEKNLKAFHNIKYAYAIMNKKNPNDFAIISNRTEWFDFYIKNNFQFIDPVLITASYRFTPFLWDENIMISSGLKMPKIFDMAKNYDVINGYTFVLHDHNHNLVVLSLIMDKSCDDNIEKTIVDKKNDIQMLLLATHEKLIALYQEVNDPHHVDKKSQKEILSKRENEILYWASMGKSYQEIALILEIKLTTVKYHVGNAIKKLGVTNAKHAIRLGVELKLIRPVLPDAE